MVTQPVYYITPQADQVFGSGQDIQIGVNITSNSSRTVNVRAEIIVYEGSINPTHGTELARYESAEYALTAGIGRNVDADLDVLPRTKHLVRLRRDVIDWLLYSHYYPSSGIIFIIMPTIIIMIIGCMMEPMSKPPPSFCT